MKEIVGHITVPASKSHAQRLLALAMACSGKSVLFGLGQSADELAALSVLKSAGCVITYEDNKTEVIGLPDWALKSNEFNVGESGLSARMLTPMLSNASFSIQLTGEGSLLTRPMHFIDSLFKDTQVKSTSTSGCLPLTLCGPLQPKSLELDGSLSSQFITGVLYSYVTSPLLRKATLTIKNPTSIPYIELSLKTLREFGVDLTLENNAIELNGPYTLKPVHLHVEGDWSSASFFIVAAAIHGSIAFENLDLSSKQADKRILDAILKFGANLQIAKTISVSKQANHSFEFDATHCPDLFPPLAVLASQANAPCRIRGVHRLTHKESNRTLAIMQEFAKFGIEIELEDDEMVIHPNHNLSIPKTIDTHNDHRIAMACAILGTLCKEPVTLENAQVVNKSFPTFYKVLEGCTANRSDVNPVNC